MNLDRNIVIFLPLCTSANQSAPLAQCQDQLDCVNCHYMHEEPVNFCDQCHTFGFKCPDNKKPPEGGPTHCL